MKDLESTLASALQDEADRTTLNLDTADAASRLEARFDQVDRDRRHRTWATALTAAAAVLVAGGVYGVTKISSGETTVQPAQTPSAPTPSTTLTQRLRVLVGNDDNGAAIHARITLYGTWGASDHPMLSDSRGRYGGLAVYRPLALAAGTGCLSDSPNTHVAQSPQNLAQQLARLPRSAVLQPPTPVRSFGRHAIHLQLRINPDCGKGVYRVAETIAGGHGISYGKPSRHVVIDFWVAAVRGVPVVVETWHQDGASTQMVDQIASSRKSITFLTRG